MTVLAKKKFVGGVTLYNGQLPDELLKSVKGKEKLYIPAADSFLKMMQKASEEGITYRLADTYRLCGEPGDGEKYLRGEIEFTQWAAWDLYQAKLKDPINPKYNKFNLASDPTNGCKSNHGYGLSIDIYTTDKTSTKDLNNQDLTQAWITKNGSIYGWVWTGKNFSKPEPWHFDYFYELDQQREPTYSPPIVQKTPTQINKETALNQEKSNLIKGFTKDVNGFFS